MRTPAPLAAPVARPLALTVGPIPPQPPAPATGPRPLRRQRQLSPQASKTPCAPRRRPAGQPTPMPVTTCRGGLAHGAKRLPAHRPTRRRRPWGGGDRRSCRLPCHPQNCSNSKAPPSEKGVGPPQARAGASIQATGRSPEPRPGARPVRGHGAWRWPWSKTSSPPRISHRPAGRLRSPPGAAVPYRGSSAGGSARYPSRGGPDRSPRPGRVRRHGRSRRPPNARPPLQPA